MPSLKIFKHLIINIKYYLTWKKKSKYFGVFIATSEFLMNFTGFLCLFFPLYHFLYYDLSQQTHSSTVSIFFLIVKELLHT